MAPGSSWAAAGATHPLGADFPGVSELDPAEILEVQRLAAHGKQITADLVRKLFLFGTAEEVLSALRPFVDHGVNHFIIYSYAYAVRPSVAAGYLLPRATPSDASAQKARARRFRNKLADVCVVGLFCEHAVHGCAAYPKCGSDCIGRLTAGEQSRASAASACRAPSIAGSRDMTYSMRTSRLECLSPLTELASTKSPRLHR